ncbi:amino acid permease [Hortaea werneckii]|uniref:Amino acid permease/ SLC12A domain-containing protein n=1 Tax=Hortaea werneckii TaxID=91943 RepID=A0A3M7IAM0_HORWE|nr:amino acid permease [Hortaea werneckii]KAI6837545.1 amino acid permease [Hortaea werneckii]KAI6900907.1 amino acid permease [Hortaea werneckii]KAI6920519.1 amino acid permease [Hortaea werneckii]KAI6954047.1 amino acid permease [Hortaea werneckii]
MAPPNNKSPNPPSSKIRELGYDPNQGDPFPLTTRTPTHPSIATPIPRDATGRPTGTPHDYTDMVRLGRTQELRRTFRSLSVLGLAVTTMSSWVALLVTSRFALIDGGLAGSVWVFFVTWACTGALVGSLAEMASMAPTSGGQYHWVSEFAPKSQQHFLSFLVGWLAALGWQALIATTAYAASVLILALAALYHPTYLPQNWHQSLLMIGIGCLGTLANTFGARRLPLLEYVVLAVHIVGFFCILIPLWAAQPLGQKASAGEVFGSFRNLGGWESIGTACYVGSIKATGAFAGSDAAVHLAEETRDASRSVPRMMVGTVLLNGAMGFVMIITFGFCITDLEAVVSSESPFPFVDVFLSATGSRAGTVCMTLIPIILSVCTSLNAIAAASRQAWALGRDQALPFSLWFRKIVTIGTPIPLNSILFSLTILIILALINIGSTAALNTIIALLTSATSFSYALSISCMLLKRLRGQPLPPARFSMGRYSVPVNMFAVGYIITAAVASFFPVSVPVDAVSMNWSVVVFGGVLCIACVDYVLRGRRHYVAPVQHVEKEYD